MFEMAMSWKFEVWSVASLIAVGIDDAVFIGDGGLCEVDISEFDRV